MTQVHPRLIIVTRKHKHWTCIGSSADCFSLRAKRAFLWALSKRPRQPGSLRGICFGTSPEIGSMISRTPETCESEHRRVIDTTNNNSAHTKPDDNMQQAHVHIRENIKTTRGGARLVGWLVGWRSMEAINTGATMCLIFFLLAVSFCLVSRVRRFRPLLVHFWLLPQQPLIVRHYAQLSV